MSLNCLEAFHRQVCETLLQAQGERQQDEKLLVCPTFCSGPIYVYG
jgi:hypothetical protein